MLTGIRVRDFAVIEDASLEPDGGLTVLTGETGAGKSILIGALQLLLGDRASSDQVRSGAERSLVEGTFRVPSEGPLPAILDSYGVPLEEGALIIRREVSAEGRSRAFLNDVSVTVGALREVGERLVDLHGQHEHQSLLRPAEHGFLLDAFAGTEADREVFATTLVAYREAAERLEALDRATADRAEKVELFRFQGEEIDALDPTDGEIEELEKELRRLEGAERLQSGVAGLIEAFSEGSHPIVDRVAVAEEELDALSRIDGGLANLVRLAHDARVAIEEIVHSAQHYIDDFDLDAERLEEVRARHSALVRLAKKYGGTMASLLDRRRVIAEALGQQVQEGKERETLRHELEVLRDRVVREGLALSAARSKAAKTLGGRIEEELEGLAMAGVAFQVAVEPRETPDGWLEAADGRRYEAGATGIDRVEFRIRTNPGAPLMPLQRIASGGEVSRVMLALKSSLGKASSVPTMVFDEIDSGIGGRTADRVGEKLAELAGTRQVIVITHLPQIARRGDRHLLVEKETAGGAARTRIRPVEGDERTRALAVLMGGEDAEESLLAHARDLLSPTMRGEDAS